MVRLKAQISYIIREKPFIKKILLPLDIKFLILFGHIIYV